MRSRGDRSLLNIFKIAFIFGYQKWYTNTVLHNIARRQVRNEFYGKFIMQNHIGKLFKIVITLHVIFIEKINFGVIVYENQNLNA